MSTKSTARAAAHPARKSAPAANSVAKRSASPAAKRSRKPPAPPPPASTDSKQTQLVTLLQSPAGGTIEQMTALTGWQAHSVRGVISGALRKRLGLNVVRSAGADGSPSVYRIVGSAA